MNAKGHQRRKGQWKCSYMHACSHSSHKAHLSDIRKHTARSMWPIFMGAFHQSRGGWTYVVCTQQRLHSSSIAFPYLTRLVQHKIEKPTGNESPAKNHPLSYNGVGALRCTNLFSCFAVRNLQNEWKMWTVSANQVIVCSTQINSTRLVVIATDQWVSLSRKCYRTNLF